MRAVLFMDMEDNTSSDSSVNNSEVLTSEAAFTNVGNSVLIATIQDFTPFLIPIDAGQDIILRLTSFCQTRNQVVYILSAVGYVIHPSIHVFNRRLTFEGRCTILSLRGVLYPISTHGVNSSNVLLMMSSADGSCFGGRVSDSLVAACPIMVVVAACAPTAPLLRSLELVSEATQAYHQLASHESDGDSNDTPTSSLSSISNDK